jgi:hypothetical protein
MIPSQVKIILLNKYIGGNISDEDNGGKHLPRAENTEVKL